MVAFVIVTAVMLCVFLPDFRSVLQGGETRATVFYCVAAGLALIITALHCFNVNLFSIYGF